MNFLAHLYLSENDEQIKLGNFIADHIRGNKYNHYAAKIQQGIILHRKIDSYTDNHEIVKVSKRRLHERYGHYDGIIIDIFYDYFLAKNWKNYSRIPLQVFCTNFYDLLDKNFEILPEKTQQLLPYIKQYNWLYNYQFLDGIEDVLKGMNRRTQGKSQMDLAIDDLKKLETEFENDFTIFFNDLKSYCAKELEKIKNPK